MSYDPNNVLWFRRMGLRFAPPRPTPGATYPKLDMGRYLHSDPGAVKASDVDPGLQAVTEYPESTREPNHPQVAAPCPEQILQNGVNDAAEVIEEEDLNAQPVSNKRIETTLSEPPYTGLEYTISTETFRKTRDRPQGASDSYWTHTLYHRVNEDGTKHNVKVHYCTSKHTMEYVCRKYFADEKILGFDMEWNAFATRDMDARENVSLIQVASESHIGLFHCALYSKNDFISPTFKRLMEDDGVSKVGVNIKADCTRLRNYMGVITRGIFELSHMYKMVKYIKSGELGRIDKVAVPLATQVQECLGLPLRKGANVRLSDWTRFLNGQQILYSASDAYAGVQLYYVLDHQRQQLDPCPPRPHFAELGMPLPIPKPVPSEPTGEERSADSSSIELRKARTPRNGNKMIDADPKFKDQRVSAAETQMQQYRSSRSGLITAGPSALRAYYIWHTNKDLKPDDIAKLLREPPLQTTTVVSYILDAVSGEKMPYSRTRLKSEVLCSLSPSAMKAAKYQPLIQACKDTNTVAQAQQS